MKFCLFLALLVRVTSSLGGEMGGEKVVEAKSQDIVVTQLDQNKSTEIVVGQLDIWQNKSKDSVVAHLDICQNKSKDIVVARLDICQNKSKHLMDEENVDHPLVSWYAWHLTSLVRPDLT